MNKDKLISQEYLKSIFKYEPETGNLVRIKYLSPNAKVGNIAGCLCKKTGYIIVSVKDKTYPLHRIVWMYLYGKFPKEQIDHINCNRSDNRLINLREATNQENQRNKKLRSDNKSGYIGVSWFNRDSKWKADIRIDGKTKHLGYYDTPEEASDAYKKVAKICFGEFYRGYD
jgi:hypothetical protein